MGNAGRAYADDRKRQGAAPFLQRASCLASVRQRRGEPRASFFDRHLAAPSHRRRRKKEKKREKYFAATSFVIGPVLFCGDDATGQRPRRARAKNLCAETTAIERNNYDARD
ncbi:hypothetical protein TW95_gp1721 [Pandoravirus inopinatum]|uniref:Uncharacterized protein n=1 Tax=Pandoravirus inopinatum TaxID=1605721 RepID=A0A0B5J910_9VIRU|nr:hypothetical protein TW95_gp1721 [Pandoravirus inopinatum]AJF98455.1 hypothetical protein [Pandoravirus inopinatum]